MGTMQMGNGNNVDGSWEQCIWVMGTIQMGHGSNVDGSLEQCR